MTARQRGWLLPPLAVCFALGLLLGRIAASPWYGLAGAVPAIVACLLLRGWGRFAAILAAALCLGCLRGQVAFHPALPAEGEYAVSGIISDAVQYRDNGQIRTTLTRVTLDGVPLGRGAYWSFYTDDPPPELAPGKAVAFRARLYHPSGAENPDGYDFREELLRRGVTVGVYGWDGLTLADPEGFSLTGFMAGLRHRLSGALREALGEETGVLASTMLLGSRSLIPQEDRAAFSRLGIAHILSVSGFHVGLLIGVLSLLFRWLRLPQGARWFLFAAALGFYSLLCGLNQPVLRASLLLLLTQRGKMLNRPRSGLHLLSAAFLLLLVISPAQLTGLSFQLSFGAVLGITLITPFISRLRAPLRPIPRRLWQGLCAAFGAQIGVLAPQLYAFQELPLLGLLMNVPVLMLSSGLILLFWAVLLTLPFPFLSVPLCAAARFVTRGLLSLVRLLGGIPGITLWTRAAGLATCLGLLLLGAGLCALLRLRGRTRGILCLLGTGIVALSLIPLPHGETVYVQFSVGGADASVIWDRDTVLVVDTGYEDGVLSDFLHRRRLTPEAVILTHLHADHIYGLRAMMEDGIPLPLLYLPEGAEKADVHPHSLELLSELRAGGTEIRHLSAGDILPLPSGEIAVLWPEKGKTRPGQDANESRLTMRLSLKGSSLLLTGDLDGRYEMYAAAPADLLKVAHHGSARSTSPDFLDRVRPAAALLSCDSPERERSVRQRLGDVPLYATATGGALTVRFVPGGYSVETFLPPHKEE